MHHEPGRAPIVTPNHDQHGGLLWHGGSIFVVDAFDALCCPIRDALRAGEQEETKMRLLMTTITD